MECKEYEINHQYDDIPKEALLTKDYEKLNNQHLVGEKQKFELLKELSKEKHCGTQYKGVNDKILGKKAPVEKVTAPTTKTTKSVSPLGSRKPTLPTAKTAREIK
jgi:hypothetical protein